ncbi:MAG: 4Fe-4S dicluster domain-containing protein [Sedimentisphaerales bacterium]|nr:4Fe-4S dicluster domain-containing protein [Sedimentisphaerales bacterium]
MTIKKLNKEVFKKFIETLIGSGTKVLGVQAKGERFAFKTLKRAEDLRLDYDVTILPPKKYFLPQVEPLLNFTVGEGYQACVSSEPFILLGVHPYDMIAINQTDTLFSQDEYDTHYMARRTAATIIACDVQTPSKNVFASSMGTATVKEGYDILLTDIGEAYLADAATVKGMQLLATITGAVDANDGDLKKREAVWQKNQKTLDKHHLNCTPSDIPALLEKAYTHPVWEEKAKTCFSCGSCNHVCPTCYCFDVQDDVNWDMKTGTRCRAWDGCMLDAFTKVAGDHTFRKNKADRFRHRLYRKGKYVPAKIGGQIACVGCGRCVGACVPDIANPAAVYNRLVADAKK